MKGSHGKQRKDPWVHKADGWRFRSQPYIGCTACYTAWRKIMWGKGFQSWMSLFRAFWSCSVCIRSIAWSPFTVLTFTRALLKQVSSLTKQYFGCAVHIGHLLWFFPSYPPPTLYIKAAKTKNKSWRAMKSHHVTLSCIFRRSYTEDTDGRVCRDTPWRAYQ